jgi:hypothetical protein
VPNICSSLQFVFYACFFGTENDAPGRLSNNTINKGRWMPEEHKITKSKKNGRKSQRAVNDKHYINKRKPSSMTAAKGDSNNGPSPKETDENGNQVTDDKPFIDKRKPSSTSALKVI